MASFCPHCGAEAPEEARFCMRCGRERSPAAPPAPAAPPPPPPPAYAPGPAQPSAVGAFFGRALRGDWAGAAQAALWPVGLLLLCAFAFALPSYGQDSDDVVVGFSDRLRIALAALLQGVGGSFGMSGGGSGPSMYGDGSGYDSGSTGTASLSVVPLLVTVVWIVALVIGVRLLRTRLYTRTVPGAPEGATAGLEAAVRVALAVTAGVLVLALFAQPDVQGVSVSSAPFLTALWTLLLALAVAGGVLHQDDLRHRVAAARPGVRTAVRAFGTAVRAMGVVLVVALVLGWIGLALFGESGSPSDVADDADFDGSAAAALGGFLALLPNFALGVLGLCWGAPLEVEARGSSSFGAGGGYEKESFGLSRLGDELGSGAVVYALGVGLVCALVVGVLAARRSVDRREQLLSAGLFFGLFLLLAGVGGVGAEFTGDFKFFGSGSGRVDLGLSVPDALLFGLLWIGAAAFLAPYLMQMAGLDTGIVPAPLPAVPGQAPAAYLQPPAQAPFQPPAAPTAPPVAPLHDPHTVHLAPPPGAPGAPGAPGGPERPKRRVGVWVGTLVGAFVIGGGAAAGVLLLQGDGDGGKNDTKNDQPVGAQTQQSQEGQESQGSQGSQGSQESVRPSAADSSPPASDTGAPTDLPDVPAGYHQVFDDLGFSFVVPDVWERQGVKNGSQITYAGSTGLENYLVGVIPAAGYTSYDNTLSMEKHLKADETKKDYRRIRLERNTFQGEDGALWEYTYEDEAGRTLHCIDQSYVAGDGTEYAILLTARDDAWSDARDMYEIALDSWRLTDTD
ncbi:zinc ribbon domain-containing protein [Streptomyces sp. KL116D]|uniref:zinc ribbon domain-containing protein n=1 Tax=Streptomyces sp. KL116D TaxID=3045152 RepID=UPI0035567060